MGTGCCSCLELRSHLPYPCPLPTDQLPQLHSLLPLSCSRVPMPASGGKPCLSPPCRLLLTQLGAASWRPVLMILALGPVPTCLLLTPWPCQVLSGHPLRSSPTCNISTKGKGHPCPPLDASTSSNTWQSKSTKNRLRIKGRVLVMGSIPEPYLGLDLQISSYPTKNWHGGALRAQQGAARAQAGAELGAGAGAHSPRQSHTGPQTPPTGASPPPAGHPHLHLQ